MPIQTPQWTDFLICPICCNEYDYLHNPISLACGHTVCKLCLSKLQRKQCPYDQTSITIDITDLPVNYALLQLVSTNNYPPQDKSQMQSKLQNNINFSSEEFQHYLKALKNVEDIALYLKPFSSATNVSGSVNVLSRPMQRKLVMLINCQLLEEEGRMRALKAARSLGERTVTELIIQHQNPQQLSTNLWAAVRARGCQFLGPAMQEEVLKLVLLALEDGSALSRKVLVMFVVQRLEPHFPQASKTSIGHVVQLLYRASCFVVSKREGDSSLMKLKEEFRTYDALRREHDAQIVEIATEAGLRIAPDQWSALLYGDTSHKSHMQSIIDKLQNPQSFAQSVQELVIALQRTGDPGNLCVLRPHLEYLAGIDVNFDFGVEIWSTVSAALEAAFIVVSGLVNFIKTHGCRKTSTDVGTNTTVHASKYKISLCRDLTMKGTCPRGISCTFAHSDEELIKYRAKHRKYHRKDNENVLAFAKNYNSNLNLKVKDDLNLEDYSHSGSVKCNDKSECRFCKVGDFAVEYSHHPAFIPSNDVIPNTPIPTNPSAATNNLQKISSSQYLVAMNHRKQQIISELQQVLSDVQNQYSVQQYDRRLPCVAYILNKEISDPPFIVNSPETSNSRSDINISNQCPSVSFVDVVPADKLNICYNNSLVPNPHLVELQALASFDSGRTIPSAPEEPVFTHRAVDWNVNYSKLCRNCTSSDNNLMPTRENCIQVNHFNMLDDVPESLLLESFKLQDKLRGLKKQITDIKDKTYEEGIINDLRALELRLECELEEEEEKLWPLQKE